MARMIPPLVAADAPRGERQLFAKLRDDPMARDWLVLHSFDIRRHVARAEGEADMLIVAPGLGVLCIEVKGCNVVREGGLWKYSYEPPKTSTVGPFRQASQAAHSIRQYLTRKDPSLGSLLFHSAVLFTEIDFADRSLEWEPWQIIGRTDFLRFPISTLVTRVLEAAHSQCRARKPVPAWYGSQSRPTLRQLESALRLLRPDFEYVASARNDVELAEAAVRRFTEEQFEALDHLEDNRRVIFKGPAGTGKTFLAVEAARRAVRNGCSVALVCFNGLLAGWLKRETEAIAKEAKARSIAFYVGNLSGLMRSIAELDVPAKADSEFWGVELPMRAVDALLTDSRETQSFDLLLVDEAQDLLSDPFLDVMELLLKGGLGSGHWAMFGDFERQAIYADKSATLGVDRLKARTAASVSTYRLRINCRNATRIAEAVTITSGLSPGYSRILNTTDSADVDPVFYRSASHQGELLLATIATLLKSFAPAEIVVLSMRADASSCVARQSREQAGWHFTSYREESESGASIRYSTVHAFKGLEAPAVVLTDIEGIDDEQAKALLYVGMSRARVRLHILMHERLRSGYDAMVDAGLKAALRRSS
ncbi:MAG: NERD domain-containing protein [Hylemonella sp.]